MLRVKEKDLYINFNNNKTSMIIVTGISGSGKSTLAQELSYKYNYEIVSFDMVLGYYEARKRTVLELDILNKFHKKYPNFKNKYNKKEIYNMFFDFVKEYITNNHINIIFDGSQFLRDVDFNKIKDQRIVLKKTPFIICIIRRTKRNRRNIRKNENSAIRVLKEIYWLYRYNIGHINNWFKDIKYFNQKIEEGEVYYEQ